VPQSARPMASREVAVRTIGRESLRIDRTLLGLVADVGRTARGHGAYDHDGWLHREAEDRGVEAETVRNDPERHRRPHLDDDEELRQRLHRAGATRQLGVGTREGQGVMRRCQTPSAASAMHVNTTPCAA
jgi:hypothetical protein